jgi:hypothetical protein
MDCCGRIVTEQDRPEACSTCQTTGPAVDELTVKALLTESALRRFEPGAYRFCPDAECAVVYFDDAGHVFRKDDVRVLVWQKEPAGNRTICYCFGETETDIRTEIVQAGVSHAVQRVREHIVAGRCACEVRNPRGVCCLGDVTDAVKRVALGMPDREVRS